MAIVTFPQVNLEIPQIARNLLPQIEKLPPDEQDAFMGLVRLVLEVHSAHEKNLQGVLLEQKSIGQALRSHSQKLELHAKTIIEQAERQQQSCQRISEEIALLDRKIEGVRQALSLCNQTLMHVPQPVPPVVFIRRPVEQSPSPYSLPRRSVSFPHHMNGVGSHPPLLSSVAVTHVRNFQ